jgi:hypothetical protein
MRAPEVASLHHRIGRHLVESPLGDKSAFNEHQHPVGHALNRVHIVFRVKHGQALMHKRAHPSHQAGPLLLGQTRSRLI